MHFFTSDEHLFHSNIIRFCIRPFENVHEMHECIIERNNEVVKPGDTVVHAGDYSFANKEITSRVISRLNGVHIFLKGSHDKWLPSNTLQIWEKKIGDHYVIVCHYSLRVWPRSHYNSWQLFGHSHGKLNTIGKQYDIGVDNNNFYPVSMDEIETIMKDKPDNFNFIGNRNREFQ